MYAEKAFNKTQHHFMIKKKKAPIETGDSSDIPQNKKDNLYQVHR